MIAECDAKEKTYRRTIKNTMQKLAGYQDQKVRQRGCR